MSEARARVVRGQRSFGKRFLALCLGVAAATNPLPGLASVLIEAGDAALRDDLSRLADRGVLSLSVSSWPLPREAIVSALSKADIRSLSAPDAAALSRIKDVLLRTGRRASHVEAGMRTTAYRVPRAFQSEPRAETELNTGGVLPFGRATIAVQLGWNHDLSADQDAQFNWDGSYAGVGFWGQLLTLGQQDRWWGSSDQGSAILGSAARPFPALSLQRSTQTAPAWGWLSWIGPWNYQIFLGQLQDYRSVPHTKLFGLRATVKPFDRVELGVNRIVQWGGEGRRESFSALWESLIGESNTSTPTDSSQDPANQLGGFDLRISPLGRAWPLALYVQYIGEDETRRNHWPAKTFGTGGIEYPFSVGGTALHLRLEAADTLADRFFSGTGSKPEIAYRNHIYPDGYYQHGLPLGYPIGGDGHLVGASLTATTQQGRRYEARLLRARLNASDQDVNDRYPQSDTMEMAAFRVSMPWRCLQLSHVLAWQNSKVDGAELAGSLTLRMWFGQAPP